MKKNRVVLYLTAALSVLMLSSCVFYDGYIGGKTPLGIYIQTSNSVGYDAYDKYTLTANGHFQSSRHPEREYLLKADGYVWLLKDYPAQNENLGTWEWDSKKRTLNFIREYWFRKL